MKRWFSLALVALFLVPVLTIPASAAEVYRFEFFEPPVVLTDTNITFPYYSDYGCLVTDVFVPEGLYHVSGAYCGKQFEFLSEVPVQWILEKSERNIYVSLTDDLDCLFDGSVVQSKFYMEGSPDMNMSLGLPTFVYDYDSEFLETDYILLERIGDLPSQGGFDSMFEDFSAFADSSIDFVSEVARTITGSPLLLLTVGFLFLGGCIGITGRLLDRR